MNTGEIPRGFPCLICFSDVHSAAEIPLRDSGEVNDDDDDKVAGRKQEKIKQDVFAQVRRRRAHLHSMMVNSNIITD